ncbi:MAG: hypothetical protein AAFQ43_03350 [Bacteroidota bacterium]
MGPFDLLPPLAPDRRGREPEANAWIELHNLIVAAESLDELGDEHLDRIRRQRGVDLRDAYYDQRVDLYQAFLDWSLQDGDFSDDNRALLGRLAPTLGLTAPDLRDTHRRAFGNIVHEALADDCLSVDERLLLYKLQHTLGLDPDLADGAFEVMARQRLLVTVARVLCDGMLSPEEAREVEEAQASLGVTVPDRVRRMLDRAATRWRESARDRLNDRHKASKGKAKGKKGKGKKSKKPKKAKRSKAAIPAVWRMVNTGRMKAVFSDPESREALASGDVFHYRLPSVLLRGVRREGQIEVSPHRVLYSADRSPSNSYPPGAIRRVLRFSNGVMVDLKGDRGVFAESDDDEALYRALTDVLGFTPAGLRNAIDAPLMPEQTWTARWTPLYAPDRDRMLRKVDADAPEAHRWSRALDHLGSAPRWSGLGTVRYGGRDLLLHDKSDRRTVSMHTLRGVHVNDRLVWLDRRKGHDWVVEFLTDEEADAFADAVLY